MIKHTTHINPLVFVFSSILFGLTSISSIADTTLLVDFAGSDNDGSITASAANFIVANNDVDTTATVNSINAEAISPNTIIPVTGNGISTNLTFTGKGFNAVSGPFKDDPILGGYIFTRSKSPSVTLTGLEEITAGTTVTLVIYSHGDSSEQIADIILTVDDGQTFTSAVTSEANPFVTFTFTTNASINSLTLTADNNGKGGTISVINGFSLTSKQLPDHLKPTTPKPTVPKEPTTPKIIASDDFSYPNGPLTGKNGGTGFSGPYTSYRENSYSSTNGIIEGQRGEGGNFRVLNNPLGNTGIIWGAFDFAFEDTLDAFGGLSLFSGDTEIVLIGDRFGTNVWNIAVPRGPFSQSKISIHNVVRTGVFRITLGIGATSSVDLWVGNDDFTPVNVSGTPHATLRNLPLEGVDTIRFASGNDQVIFDDFILANTAAKAGASLSK